MAGAGIALAEGVGWIIRPISRKTTANGAVASHAAKNPRSASAAMPTSWACICVGQSGLRMPDTSAPVTPWRAMPR